VTGLLLRALPFATVIIAAIVPLAAGLYLATTTAWAAAERAVFHRLSPPLAAPAVSNPPRSLKRVGESRGPGV
jgi:YidC/Oxa1 family membrane protein insertase